jgi:hypothetical protein
MHRIAKLIITSVASTSTMPLLASANPSHEGHEFIWDFHGIGLWNSPITLFMGAMLFSALVFRYAFRGKS